MPSELKADIATINELQPPDFTDAQSQRLTPATKTQAIKTGEKVLAPYRETERGACDATTPTP